MVKSKVVRKPVKLVTAKPKGRSVKKVSHVYKTISKPARVTSKRKWLFIKIAILALIVFIAGSIYQLFTSGTGPLTFFTGSPEIMMIAEEDRYTTRTSTTTRPITYTPTTTTNRTTNRREDEDAAPAPAAPAAVSSDPCANICTPGNLGTDACRQCARQFPTSPAAAPTLTIINTPVNPPPTVRTDPCETACDPGGAAGTGPGSAACNACAVANPTSAAAATTVTNTTTELPKTACCINVGNTSSCPTTGESKYYETTLPGAKCDTTFFSCDDLYNVNGSDKDGKPNCNPVTIADPCQTACGNGQHGSAACRACAGANPTSVIARITVENLTTPLRSTTPGTPDCMTVCLAKGTPASTCGSQCSAPTSTTDPCKKACSEGPGTGKGTQACNACAIANPYSPLAIASARLTACCSKDESNPSCVNPISGKNNGIKYERTVAGKRCGLGQFNCNPYFTPTVPHKSDEYACTSGGVGGGGLIPALGTTPQTPDDACKKILPSGARYRLVGQTYIGKPKCAAGELTFEAGWKNTEAVMANCNKKDGKGCAGTARCCVTQAAYNTASNNFCNTLPLVVKAQNKITGQIEEVQGVLQNAGMTYGCRTDVTDQCLNIGNYSSVLPVDKYGAPSFEIKQATGGTKNSQDCGWAGPTSVTKGYCCQNILQQN